MFIYLELNKYYTRDELKDGGKICSQKIEGNDKVQSLCVLQATVVQETGLGVKATVVAILCMKHVKHDKLIVHLMPISSVRSPQIFNILFIFPGFHV